jgi:hypothetical protein
MEAMAVVPPTIQQVSLPDVSASVLHDVTVLVHLHVLEVSDETLAGRTDADAVVLK